MVTAERVRDEQPVSDYLHRLGLDAEPLGGAVEYFYAGADRRNVLDQMVHYCRFSEQLVVLSAVPGSGKTTLVDSVVVQLNSIMDCCRIPAADIASAENIISTLGRILNLSLSSLSTRDFLDSLGQRTVVDGELEPVLVIIEQAENLTLVQLQSLVSLHEIARSSMHLLLVGATPLQRRIGKIAQENPNIKQFTLRNLSLPELESYTLSRLQSVGYRGEQPFSQDQLAILHEQSGGVIAEINRMMPLLLEGELEAGAAGKREFLPRAHLLVIAVLFLVLLAGLVFELGTQTDEQDGGEESVVRATLELPVSLSPRQVERAPVSKPALPEPPAQVARATIERVAPKPVAIVPALKPDRAPGVEEAGAEQVVIARDAPARLTAQAEVKPAPPAQPVLPATPRTARDQRLLAMNASDYLLQVLGSSNEAGVRDYVKQYVNQLPVSYFETTMRGKPWYVVVVGPYASREQAQQAVQGFPPELKKQSPWVRTVASIQSDIRAR